MQRQLQVALYMTFCFLFSGEPFSAALNPPNEGRLLPPRELIPLVPGTQIPRK